MPRGIPNKKNRGEDKTKWFFLDGVPYSIIKIDRHDDFVYCQEWPSLKRVGFPWSFVRKKGQKAYVTTEVCEILNRSKTRIAHYVMDGYIKPAAHINMTKLPFKGFHLYTEKEILEAHDFFLTMTRGPKPKDKNGIPRTPPKSLPTRAEVKARLRGSPVQYIKNKEGEFIPVWKENDW